MMKKLHYRSRFPICLMIMFTCIFTAWTWTGHCASGTGPSSDTVITLAPNVEIPVGIDGMVTLGQVASLACKDSMLLERLKVVPLGPKPLLGTTRRLTRDYITLRLRQAKLDPKSVTFAGAGVVELLGVSIGKSGSGGLTPGNADSAPNKGKVSVTAITKGQSVAVEAINGPFAVTTRGKALDSGVSGDSIRVQLEATAKVVLGVILGSSVVSVSKD